MIIHIKKNWFLIGVAVVILFAKWYPPLGAKGGVLKPEITVKYGAVSFIFLSSGLSINTQELTQAFFQLNVHMFVQCFTFAFFPIFIHGVVAILQAVSFDKLLLDGLTVLSCMPPPVSSAVILTKAVGGNEAAAIFNSAFGSFLGIFFTPVLVLATVGSEAAVPAGEIALQLTLTVVLPLICGQLIQFFYKTWLMRAHIPFSSISSGVLLFIIYTAFCDTFSHKDVKIDSSSLLLTVFIVVAIQAFLILLVFYVTTNIQALGFRPGDVIALLFCCTHKSLTLGIPIIKIIFSKFDGISVITIPLLIYHPTQILLGGMLVPVLRSWLSTTATFRAKKAVYYSV